MSNNNNIIDLIKAKDNEGLELLLGQDPSLAEGRTAQGISYLMFAIYCRNKEASDMIRERRLSIDFFEACSLGELNTVSEYITQKPSLVNTFSADGFTALGLACFFGHLILAEFLIESGADIDRPSNNPFKVAPIHSACAISNYDLVELLLKNGAKVNVKQASGVTPLHSAAHNGNTQIARLLVDADADIKARADNGQTPLFMAEEKGFEETADFIRSQGGSLI